MVLYVVRIYQNYAYKKIYYNQAESILEYVLLMLHDLLILELMFLFFKSAVQN